MSSRNLDCKKAILPGNLCRKGKAMRAIVKELSVLEKLKLEEQPVGINYYFYKPEGLPRVLYAKSGEIVIVILRRQGNLLLCGSYCFWHV